MSTRAMVQFVEDGQVVARVFRHTDGYPEGMLPDFAKFFDEIEQTTDGDTRFDDLTMLAARYVVYLSQEHFTTEYKADKDGEWKHVRTPRLKFLSVRIMEEDASDAAWIYRIEAPEARGNARGARGSARPQVSYKGSGEPDSAFRAVRNLKALKGKRPSV